MKFESLDRDTHRELLGHYRIITSLIKNTYKDMSCNVINEDQIIDTFTIKTEIRQRCLLSSLFLLSIDWIMKETTEMEKKNSMDFLGQTRGYGLCI
jgi:hypothetical protein